MLFQRISNKSLGPLAKSYGKLLCISSSRYLEQFKIPLRVRDIESQLWLTLYIKPMDPREMRTS